MELELFWKGPYKINIETPEGEKGKHGLYVFFYDSEIIYIGIAAGAMHLYQESKFRYRPLKRAFVELGVANEQIKREDIDKIMDEHCTKCVGELRDESKLPFLKCAENLLVFKKEPKGNELLKNKYKCIIPFRLINKGDASALIALGFNDYEICANSL